MPSRRKSFYKIAKIVGHRQTSQGLEYRVRWAGFSAADDTWEPEKNLRNCQDYIQDYIMSNVGKKTRRSARLATPTVNVVVYSTDEEGPSSPKPKRSTRKRPARKTKGPKNDTQVKITVNEPVTKTYALRSTADVDVSSDDEVSVRYTTEKPTGRMALSEARFRKQVSNKGTYLSSTPYSDVAISQSRSKTEHFENSHLVKSQHSTTSITVDDDGEVAEEYYEEITEDDVRSPPVYDVEVKKEKNVKYKRRTRDDIRRVEVPTWLAEVGWKEFALASFLTGVGVMCYICYCTDYCTYC